jgi:hypothetical protein
MSALPPLPKKLGFLLFVLSDDRTLYSWFCSLRGLAPSDRIMEIGTLARKLQETNGDPKIVDALFHMTRPGQFEIVYQALDEHIEESKI